ncbi:MAG: PAS domain S-box protein [Dehalococcoidia bacterium]|nr:PAS domain S-box protein [Dehalococcoidia bacterium]
MSSEILRKEVKVQFRQLEALILFMAGATLASLQIIHYVFLSSGIAVTGFQMILDWLFGMSIIFLLVHFSFREIYKIHNELIVQREQASKAEKRIQHILDTTQDVIFTLDREGNFTFANKTLEALTGYPLEKVINTNIQFVLSPEYRSFIPEQLKNYKDLNGRHLYIDVAKSDGEKVPVELSFMPIKNRSGELSGFQGIARDITEHKEIEQARLEKERSLKAMARVGQILLETKKDIPYKKILEILGDTSEIQNSFILLNDTSEDNISAILKQKAKSGPSTNKNSEAVQKPRIYINCSNKGNGYGADSRTIDMLLSENGIMELSKKEGAIVSSNNGHFSTLILPLMVNSEFAGVVGFDKPVESKGWKPVEINLLATSATMLSQAIERQKAGVQIKQHFVQLTRIVSQALFAVDPYTVSHQERLATLANYVGERLGLTDDQLEWLQVGALLHDIGKAAVPNTILSKPGKLTDEEWVLIRSHVKRGHEMLQGMNLPDHVMDMVLTHHERLDGTGYPNGLRGDKLSLEARILGICDVVEAMSSHRPYRPARSKNDIIDELKRGREQQYDPKIADMLIDMVDKNEFDFELSQPQKLTAMG